MDAEPGELLVVWVAWQITTAAIGILVALALLDWHRP